MMVAFYFRGLHMQGSWVYKGELSSLTPQEGRRLEEGDYQCYWQAFSREGSWLVLRVAFLESPGQAPRQIQTPHGREGLPLQYEGLISFFLCSWGTLKYFWIFVHALIVLWHFIHFMIIRPWWPSVAAKIGSSVSRSWYFWSLETINFDVLTLQYENLQDELRHARGEELMSNMSLGASMLSVDFHDEESAYGSNSGNLLESSQSCTISFGEWWVYYLFF